MDAAFVPYTALFDGAVKDVLSAGCADRFASVTQEEPRNIISPFTLPLRPPVVSQLLEQTVTQWQDTLLVPPLPLRTRNCIRARSMSLVLRCLASASRSPQA